MKTHIKNLKGEHVLIRTKDNLTYNGIIGEESINEGVEGFYLIMNLKTKFSVWCPYDQVKKIFFANEQGGGSYEF